MIINFLVLILSALCSTKALHHIPLFIRQHYGQSTLRTLRDLERAYRKRIKRLADVEFLKTCLVYKLNPKLTNFKLNRKSNQNLPASTRLKTNIIRAEIQYNLRQIGNLNKTITNLESALFGVVSYFHSIWIKSFFKVNLAKFFCTVTETHNRKLKNLGLHINTSLNTSAVFNMSKIELSESELKLLSKGLRYSIFPSRINEKEIQAQFEGLFTQAESFMNVSQKIEFKACLINCYSLLLSSFKFYRNTDYYFSKSDRDTIYGLKKKCDLNQVLLIKADKGNTVVVIDKAKYIEGMNAILSDESKFETVENDNTLDRQEKLQLWLRSNIKNIVSDKEYSDMYPTCANLPVLYGLPKIHKLGAPMRPILSMIGSLNYGFAKFISKLLDPIRYAPSQCKESFSLASYLSSSSLNNFYFVSFDVASLFTNVPLDETIDIILDKLYPNKDKKLKVNGMTRLIFKRALEWCLKGNIFIFNGKLYRQTDGVAMGSPLAPALADIFMNHIFEKQVSSRTADWENIVVQSGTVKYNAKLFLRYVDDILACFKNSQEADLFLNFLNSLHPNITFTIECECPFGKISFLDLFIIKDYFNEKILVQVYRKPTHSGVYSHFTSFLPDRFKRQALTSLLERAYKICSQELLHREFDNLKRMFMSNGYNEEFISRTIKEFLERKSKDKVIFYGPEKYKIYISLPYLGDVSAKIRGNITSCLSRIKCGSLKLVYTDTFSRLGDWFNFKDRQPSHMVSGAVYKLSCSCGLIYVGESGKCIFSRFKEHCKTNGKNLTTFGKHLKSSPTCHVDFDTSVKILAKSHHISTRKTIESLFIQEHKDDPNILNEMYSSKKLFLFNI